MDKEQLMAEIAQAVVDMEEELTEKLCIQAIEMDIPAYDAIQEGLIVGMDEVSRLYDEEEYFVPEVLGCSDAMYAGLNILKPHLDKSMLQEPLKVVIGVVEGDTHDIGKNMVKLMLETAGMEVYDLGRDVPLQDFIDKAEEMQAQVIAMSTLMTTAMDGMRQVVQMLTEKNIRSKYKVIIGGGPISADFAHKIGADIYSKDATEAVRVLKQAFNLA